VTLGDSLVRVLLLGGALLLRVALMSAMRLRVPSLLEMVHATPTLQTIPTAAAGQPRPHATATASAPGMTRPMLGARDGFSLSTRRRAQAYARSPSAWATCFQPGRSTSTHGACPLTCRWADGDGMNRRAGLCAVAHVERQQPQVVQLFCNESVNLTRRDSATQGRRRRLETTFAASPPRR